jgi:hypothetical protein
LSLLSFSERERDSPREREDRLASRKRHRTRKRYRTTWLHDLNFQRSRKENTTRNHGEVSTILWRNGGSDDRELDAIERARL